MVYMYRQGDVLFIKVKEMPKSRRRKIKSDIVIRGEATGHTHKLINGTMWGAMNERGATRRYIKARVGTKVVHEEHEEIKLDPGLYIVVRQREYDPANPDGEWVED
jgi:hypothetical protein